MNAAVGEIEKLNEQLSQLRQETRDQREKICQMLVRPFFIRLALMNHDEKNCHIFPKNKKRPILAVQVKCGLVKHDQLKVHGF